MLKPYIAKVLDNQNLSQEDAFQAMEIIMTGQSTPAQVGAYLVGLRMKGETVEEITGSARAMRSVSEQIDLEVDGPVLDTAGTGGDGAQSINISTAAAFVIAGAGYPMAKHGNRAASSKCGSADVLEALGVAITLSPDKVKTCIEEIDIGFMFAPLFHPAMKHAIGPRREIGQRTIFNILGPLTNPANATHQLIGVYAPSLTETFATVLGELGVEGAVVVHGHNGMDEFVTNGINQVSQLKSGQVDTYQFDPKEYDLRPASKEDLMGGDAEKNAHILKAILEGEDTSPRADVVLLNAAAAISAIDGDINASLEKARSSLSDGKAAKKLSLLVEVSQRLSKEA